MPLLAVMIGTTTSAVQAMRRMVSMGRSMSRPQSTKLLSCSPSHNVAASMSTLNSTRVPTAATFGRRRPAPRLAGDAVSTADLWGRCRVWCRGTTSRALLFSLRSRVRPVSGSNSPCRHHIPVSRSTQLRRLVAWRWRCRRSMPSSAQTRRTSPRTALANSSRGSCAAARASTSPRPARRCCCSALSPRSARVTTSTCAAEVVASVQHDTQLGDGVRRCVPDRGVSLLHPTTPVRCRPATRSGNIDGDTAASSANRPAAATSTESSQPRTRRTSPNTRSITALVGARHIDQQQSNRPTRQPTPRPPLHQQTLEFGGGMSLITTLPKGCDTR